MRFTLVSCLMLIVFSSLTPVCGKTESRASSENSLAHVGSSSLGVEDFFDLSQFGAVGDGVTDDGPALQNALNAIAAAGGGTLFVPAGRYAINTPVQKDFSGLASALTILGVESLTPVPPVNSPGIVLSRGLDLSSEFVPRTGEAGIAININGLQSFLIKDISFAGTPDVFTDALITLALSNVSEATITHCEFYGLSSLIGGGAIVQSVRSHLTIEQSVFLGCTGNSGVNNSVVQNVEWKGFKVADSLFVDYGQRPGLYGKLNFSTSFSWVNIGNAAAPEADSPRREVVISNVFFDEGGYIGLSSTPDRYLPASAPIDLIYVSGLYMNVSNLNAWGNYLSGVERVLIEDSHYGWSHAADAAIGLVSVGNAILDQVSCEAGANRIRADAATGKLTVINSLYTFLDSQSPDTRVITTETPADDPVQYVRQQFTSMLGRNPDAAAHFYWTDRLLQCGDDKQCATAERAALAAYLSTTPNAVFSVSGTITDDSGAGLRGAIVRLSGSQSATTLTGEDGTYSFAKLPTSGVYNVTVDRVNYTFDMPQVTITTPNRNQTADFAAVINQYEISGRIVDSSGLAMSGVTVSLTGSQSGSTTTDDNGTYSFTVPAEDSYIVSPAMTSHFFLPASASFTDLSGNQIANFTGSVQNKIGFSAKSYDVSEGGRTITVIVNRSGDTANAAEAIYSATDGTAQQRSDVIPIIGRLSFEPGETNKSFIIFITDDSYVEGDESLTLQLIDPTGGNFDDNNATLSIADNDSESSSANPIDGARFFVRQQYRDFLNRPADAAGLDFWSNQITSCGTDAYCISDRRMNVSAAFFLSIEFQETGFLVYRLYKSAYAEPPQHLNEFLLDTRTIGQGVVVNAPGWQELLETNKAAFIAEFVARSRFSRAYPLDLAPADFVNELNSSAGDALSANEIEAAIGEFAGSATSEDTAARARVLRRVAESQTLSQRELNPAFVLMQYFSYLQRNPAEAPDDNLDGYNFWLQKLNEFGGDFRSAEMVKSFLVSTEYRARFGAP